LLCKIGILNIQGCKAKNETLNIDELFFLRNILIKRIESLKRSIERLPVLQNNNNRFSNNLVNNDNQPLTVLKPKPKSEREKMTEKEKLKMQRKKADKSQSKQSSRNYLQKEGTYSKKTNKNTRAFLDLMKAKEVPSSRLSYAEILSAERAIEELENRKINYGENFHSNASSTSNTNNWNNGYGETEFSENNYNRYGRPELVPTTSGYSMYLSASEARNYHNGLWNRIHVPSKWSNSRQTRSRSQIKPHVSNSESENNSRRSHSRNSRLENSNSGYVSNNQFLGNRFKRRAESKQKRGSLEFTSE